MQKNQPKQFLGYLHNFRGFAIINIVAIHAVVFAFLGASNFNFNPNNPIAIANEVLFHNATIYFAVISGILFSAVLKSKGYEAFYIGKFKNVILPYLFFTLIFSIFAENSNKPFAILTNFTDYYHAVIRNFIYGKANFVYWYIPILIFLYLATPLVDYLINLKKIGKYIFLLLLSIPLVVSRIEMMELMQSDFLSLQTMLYFLGAYVAGMYIGIDLEKRLAWVKNNFTWLIVITLITTIALVYIQLKNIDMIGRVSVRATLYYIQKICVSGIVIILLKNMGERKIVGLHQIAKDGFAIFFLHGFLIFVLIGILMPILSFTKIAPFNIFIGAFLMLVLSIAVSMLIVFIFRKIFGDKSRMIIGA